MAGSKVKHRVVGLLGGTGAGKSTAAAWLAESGCSVIDADRISREVMYPGTNGYAAVVDAFGREIVSSDGTIDRGRLAAIVFSDEVQLERLERIVHPLMREAIQRRIDEAESRVVVLDCAVLLRSTFRALVDEIWLMTASDDVRRARIMRRDGLTEEQATLRMQAQQSESEMAAAAQMILHNDAGTAELYSQLERALSAVSGGN